MQIFVFDEQKDLIIIPAQVKRLVEIVVNYEGKKYDEVSIYLVDKNSISEMHLKYFNDPSSTDCISFPIDSNDEDSAHKLMGDVFVCPRVAVEYADKHALDSYSEVSLYITHGLLHLMGYDDLESSKRRKMRKAEKRHMENLAKSNALLSSSDYAQET